MKKLLLSIIVGLYSSPSVSAMPVTFTGADLVNNPLTVFPNSQTVIIEDSFRLTTSGDRSFVVEFDLDSIVQNVNDFSFSVNLTRGSGDFDPTFSVSDGSTFVGAIAADNSLGSLVREVDIVTVPGVDATLDNFTVLETSIGFPVIGQSFDVNYSFQVFPDRVAVTAGFFNREISFVEQISLNSASGLSLVFLSNSAGEVYQLNSITFQNAIESTPVTDIPEPSTLPMTLLPLAGLIVWRRRRRT